MSTNIEAAKRSSFYRSSTKQKIRNDISNLLHNFKGVKTVLTLGGLYAHDAKMFASQNSRVISIERDKEIFNSQKKELNQYANITPILGKLEDLIKQSFMESFEFDLAYLDYLGPYTLSKENTIATLFSKKIMNKGSYLCLTFELAREDSKHFENSILKNITCGDDVSLYFKDRENILEQAIKDIARKYGKKLSVVCNKTYRNNEDDSNVSGGTPPMLLLIMKVVS